MGHHHTHSHQPSREQPLEGWMLFRVQRTYGEQLRLRQVDVERVWSVLGVEHIPASPVAWHAYSRRDAIGLLLEREDVPQLASLVHKHGRDASSEVIGRCGVWGDARTVDGDGMRWNAGRFARPLELLVMPSQSADDIASQLASAYGCPTRVLTEREQATLMRAPTPADLDKRTAHRMAALTASIARTRALNEQVNGARHRLRG